MSEVRVAWTPPTSLEGTELQRPLGGAVRGSFYAGYGKRLLDLAIVIPLLILLSISLLVIVFAVWRTSPGGAIFRQQRIGKDGRAFTVLKFRTMEAVAGSNFRQFVSADGTTRHKLPDDPRVTPLGRLLRRTSLDELPQLINVLRGDMSLIGPRPELPEIVSRYEAWQHGRHVVRPGLTGWWQIHGRGEGLMCERTDLDLYYVERMSFRLDLAILFKTFRAVVVGKGAF